MGENDTSDKRLEDYMSLALRAGLSAIPVLGGPVLELFNFAVAEPSQERRDDFVTALMERIIELENKHEELSPEALRSNVAFQATCIQAAQSALRTAQGAKLEMLRNAVINSALAGSLDENIRHMFMQFIDRVTALHVALLTLLNNPDGYPGVPPHQGIIGGSISLLIEAGIPQLRGKKDFLKIVTNDLEGLGLVRDVGLNVMMTGAGMRAGRTTELGKSFLGFISDPETGKTPGTFVN